jgi:hypothetical protein
MNKYYKYKDSGIEWIGENPEHCHFRQACPHEIGESESGFL